MRLSDILKIRNYIILFLLIPGVGIFNLGKIFPISVLLLIIIDIIIIHLGKYLTTKSIISLFSLFTIMIVSLILNNVEYLTILYVLACSLTGLTFYKVNNLQITHLIKLFVFLAVINIGIAILQLINPTEFDNFFYWLLHERSNENYHFTLGRLTTIWKEAPRLGCFVTAISPFICYYYKLTKKISLLILVIFLSIITLFTITRVSIFIQFIILIFYFKPSKLNFIKIAYITTLLFITILLFQNFSYLLPEEYSRLFNDQKDFSTSESGLNRIGVYTLLLPLIPDNLFLGSGFAYKEILKPYGFSSPHNLLLQLLLVFGLPITIWILHYFFQGLKPILKSIKQNFNQEYTIMHSASLCILAISISSMFHGLFFDLPIFLLLWISISITLNNNNNINNKNHLEKYFNTIKN